MRDTIGELASKIVLSGELDFEIVKCHIRGCWNLPFYNCIYYESRYDDDNHESEEFLLCAECFEKIEEITSQLRTV